MITSNSLNLSEKHSTSRLQTKSSSTLNSNTTTLKYIDTPLVTSNATNNSCIQQRYNLNVGKLATSRYNNQSNTTNKTPKERARNKRNWQKCYSPHHIIPNCVVTHAIAPVLGSECYGCFNEAWNGIMLPRSPEQRGNCLYKTGPAEKANTLPAHLEKKTKCDHHSYSAQVYTLVKGSEGNLNRLIDIANQIRAIIKRGNATGNSSLCLDNISLAPITPINTNDNEDPPPGDFDDNFEPDYDEESPAMIVEDESSLFYDEYNNMTFEPEIFGDI